MLSVCLFVRLPVRLFVCLSVCLSVCPSVRLRPFVRLPPAVRLFVCLPVCLSVCLPICLCVCSLYAVRLFVSLSLSLSVCLSVCLSFLVACMYKISSYCRTTLMDVLDEVTLLVLSQCLWVVVFVCAMHIDPVLIAPCVCVYELAHYTTPVNQDTSMTTILSPGELVAYTCSKTGRVKLGYIEDTSSSGGVQLYRV